MKRIAPVPFIACVHDIENAVVLLDVDGTLIPDGDTTEIAPQVVEAVQVLKSRNQVYLVSNGVAKPRVEELARILGVVVAPAGVPAGKPSPKAAEGIERGGKAVVVIGDKYMTDGRFAKNLGARFILTERVRSGTERPLVKLSYLIDRVVSWVL